MPHPPPIRLFVTCFLLTGCGDTDVGPVLHQHPKSQQSGEPVENSASAVEGRTAAERQTGTLACRADFKRHPVRLATERFSYNQYRANWFVREAVTRVLVTPPVEESDEGGEVGLHLDDGWVLYVDVAKRSAWLQSPAGTRERVKLDCYVRPGG